MPSVRGLVSVQHWLLHPSLLILWIIAECLALTSLVLIIYWAKEFYGGFAWDGSGKEFNYHPVFMTLGLVIIYGNAAICYRIFRYQDKFMMKIIHASLNALSFIFTVLGLVTVFNFHNAKDIPNMYSIHSWIGLGTVILFSSQLVLGFLFFLIPIAGDNLRAQYLKIHSSFGLAILSLAIVAIISGLTEKLLFSFLSKYSKFQKQGNIANAYGVVITLFAMVIGFILYHPAYKRDNAEPKILPEQTHKQFSSHVG